MGSSREKTGSRRRNVIKEDISGVRGGGTRGVRGVIPGGLGVTEGHYYAGVNPGGLRASFN